MDELFNLFLVLQISKSITIYPVNFPANSLIYIKELRSVVDFEMLDPNLVLQFIMEKTEVQEKILLDKNLENSGVSSVSMLDMMGGYIFILGAFVIFLVIMGLLMMVLKKHR